MPQHDTRTIEEQIRDASEAVERFDASLTPERALERLRAHNPRHLWLVMADGLWFGAAVMGLGVLVTLVLVLFSSELAGSLALLETVAGLPTPLVLAMLGLMSLALSLGARRMATEWGATRAPLLPRELMERQALVAEQLRLESLVEVRKRTPQGAPDRPDYLAATEPWRPYS